MSPLERRYRRLLRLLPAEHRATRGEELLGMLLDLDGHRPRPSFRQAAGVVGLALRLRLAGPASLLLAGYLIAFGTAAVQIPYSVETGNLRIIGSPAVIAGYLVLPSLLRFAIAVAWAAGAPRTTLLLAAGELTSDLLVLGKRGYAVIDLPVLMVVAVAVFWRWPVPRSRPVLLAAIPLTAVVWVLAANWQSGSPDLLLGSMTLAIALGAGLIGRLGSAGDLRHADVQDPPADG